MYESFYGLKDKPFTMLPDPGFLYLSKKHQSALTMLEYALYNNAGFCVISGDIGTGKTTLLRKLLENMEENVTVGMITNTHQSFGELLDWVLSAFGIHKAGLSKVEMHQAFIDFLLQQYARKKTALLIVDEAQNMDVKTLEELRMLSNINSEKDQLLQIILAGQPELKQTLRQPELRQFVQRIAVDYHLGPLSLEETFGYIQHRLIVAGARRNVFTPLACQRIHDYSGGVPRLINLLCDTAMVYGFADQSKLIGENLVDEMVRERMADSLVPIVRAAESRLDQGLQQASDEGPEQDGNNSLTTPPNPSHVSQLTSELAQATTPPAEKKTAGKTLKSVPLTPRGLVRRASLTAAEAPSELIDAIAPELLEAQVTPEEPVEAPEIDVEPIPIEIPQALVEDPPVAESNTGDEISDDELKSLFDYEATLEAEAADAAEAQLRHQSDHDQPVETGPTRQRLDNRIEVVQAIPISGSGSGHGLLDKWVIMALVAMVVVVLMLVTGVFSGAPGTGLYDTKPVEEKAIVNQNELPAEVKRKLEEAEQLRQKLEQVKRDEQALKERHEAEARELEQQRDEALSIAEQEKRERLKKAEEAKQAAEKARAIAAREAALKAQMEAARQREQEAQKQKAEQEAARKQAEEKDLKLAVEKEEARARELELEWRQTQQLVPSADTEPGVTKPADEAVPSWRAPATDDDASVVTPEAGASKTSSSPEFVLDPCNGPSAKFLSTCRR